MPTILPAFVLAQDNNTASKQLDIRDQGIKFYFAMRFMKRVGCTLVCLVLENVSQMAVNFEKLQ